MSVSEGLLDPAFWTLGVKNNSRSEGSAPCVWELSTGSALAPGSASRGEGRVLGRSLEMRVSWDNSVGIDVWVCPRSGELSIAGLPCTPMGE